MDKLCTIIVTYNGMAWIHRCLESLSASSCSSMIIVVDNGSTDGTVDFIRRHFPSVHLVESKKNLGFGQGNNLGIQQGVQASCNYFFLLNQDAWVETETLAGLVESMKKDSTIGLLSPVHLNGKGDALDEHFAQYLQAAWPQVMEASSFDGLAGQGTIVDVPMVNAAAWMLSADCVRRVGGFDPAFPHYGEDDNYAQRVRYMGFRVAVHSGVRIFHDKDRVASVGPSALQKKVYQAWIQVLVYACDIHRRDGLLLLGKRAIRHAMLSVKSSLGGMHDDARFHHQLARRILGSFRIVHRSRQKSRMALPFNHLVLA